MDEQSIKTKYAIEPTHDDWKWKYSLRNPIGFFMLFNLMRVLTGTLNYLDIKLKDTKEILDLGCGDGTNLQMIAMLKCTSEGLHGIDLSEARVEYGKRVNPGIDLQVGSILKLPFADNSMDMITEFVCFMFLDKEEDLKQVYKEVYRVLKPKGYFVMFDTMLPHEYRHFNPTDVIKDTGLEVRSACGVFRLVEDEHGTKHPNCYVAGAWPLDKLFAHELPQGQASEYANFLYVGRKV